MFSDCGGFRDIRWVVNWSAVFVETVFESSFGFSYVLFGAVVAMYHVNDVFGVIGLVSPVELNVYEVCPSDMYLQERQFFPHGYEAMGLVMLCEIAKFGLN